MEYKSGDEVKIIDEEEYCKITTFPCEMQMWFGKSMTIEQTVDEMYYIMKEDGGAFRWTEELIEYGVGEKKELLKKYLNQYYRKRKKKKDLERRLDNFKEEMLGIKGMRYSQMPKSNTNTTVNEPLDFKIKCEAIQERIDGERKTAASSMLKVMDILEYLDDSTERDVLEYRFLDGEAWKEITKKVAMSKSRCIDYYNMGLEKLLRYKKIRVILEDYERGEKEKENKKCSS